IDTKQVGTGLFLPAPQTYGSDQRRSQLRWARTTQKKRFTGMSDDLNDTESNIAGRPIAGRPIAGRPSAGRPATDDDAEGHIAGKPVTADDTEGHIAGKP